MTQIKEHFSSFLESSFHAFFLSVIMLIFKEIFIKKYIKIIFFLSLKIYFQHQYIKIIKILKKKFLKIWLAAVLNNYIHVEIQI